MRSHVRTIVVLAVAVALVALFLSQRRSLAACCAAIVRARPEWLALSLATMFVNLAIRALRWQYLLEPLGPTDVRERVSRDGGRVRGEQRAAGARRRGHSPVFPRAQAPRDQQDA